MSEHAANFSWPRKTSILGTGLSLAGKDEVIALLSLWLKSGNKRAIIVTANAEILLWASEHSSYQQILNKAPLVTIDGFGVFCALFWHKILRKIEPSIAQLWQLRFTGRQLLENICLLAPARKWRIFLLGGQSLQAAKKTAQILQEKHGNGQKLLIQSWPGPLEVAKETTGEWRETKMKINAFKPDFIFIAFGYPKPEEWLAKHAKDLDFGVALGVGGVFNEIAGFRKAAPSWVNRLGLESYWRLLTEPKRFKRIFRALIKFPLAVVFGPS
ncbi:MAG: N-acetylmannosaminyltransferase [Candidatus Yanofskybacteria bacterium GW2011_GWA1_48_10]|uniref:N-acetylmannosaminyltransferase n=1 Tax=Candidatus Yanofskybacteria bacterium GW2011_GWA1_48_10 TaxID=1619022 RepID=A0A0G1U6X6_9BACT|nr:MAG: N-acetylmannosaminyltransferase [Microgenomates group bacterium GW2011_GWA2_44_7]KKU89839.1 MAG: N-acetylmannosaminyltransferase [Candidatus Yanofskybacteria bacterium GW2011_GWA1_48_10]